MAIFNHHHVIASYLNAVAREWDVVHRKHKQKAIFRFLHQKMILWWWIAYTSDSFDLLHGLWERWRNDVSWMMEWFLFIRLLLAFNSIVRYLIGLKSFKTLRQCRMHLETSIGTEWFETPIFDYVSPCNFMCIFISAIINTTGNRYVHRR